MCPRARGDVPLREVWKEDVAQRMYARRMSNEGGHTPCARGHVATCPYGRSGRGDVVERASVWLAIEKAFL